jgi:hypothetical protein
MATNPGDGNLTQGAQLPSSITTTQAQATAPQFYTDYLQNVANLGQNAIQQGGVAGFSPLQQQAFRMAPQTAFAGADTLGQAGNMIGQAGNTTVPQVVGQYMNPYTSGVVNEMGRLQQQNIRENVLPNINAGAIGSGQFGSQRQMQATGNTMRDMQANLLGQQTAALQSGYTSAQAQAGQDLSRLGQAGQMMSSLGAQQQQLGLGGLNQLLSMGKAQQDQGQRMLDQPMINATAYSRLLQGLAMPTGSTTQVTAPGQQGQFANSPLSEITGLLAAIGAFLNNKTPTATTPAKP